MQIKTEIDETKQLTTFTAAGEIELTELLAMYRSYYGEYRPTRNMLWDFRSASGGNKLSHDQLEYLASFPKRYATNRPAGKTAFVVGGDLGFGLGRMLATFVEFQNVQVIINVFRSIDEARRWTEEDESSNV